MISSKIIINSLLKEKIEYLFGYPGGSILHIYDAIFISKIKHILVRHEQAAVHIADGYFRSSFKKCFVIVTSGPGYTNCITGLATASIDYSKIFLICGQVPKNLVAQNAFQETNHLCISLPIVHQFNIIKCFYNIPYIIFNSLNENNFGSSVFEFSKDITALNNKTRFKYPIKKKRKIIKKKIRINAVKYNRIILIIGGGLKKKDVYNKINDIISNLKIPFLVTLMGISSINYRSPCYLGIIGMHGDSFSNILIHYSDLIICICTRLDDRITNNIENFSPYSKIIHLDINFDFISKNIFCKNYFLFDINNCNLIIINKKRKTWWKIILFYIILFNIKYKNNFFFCNPQQIIEILFYISRGKLFICTDVGQHQMFAAKYYNYNYNKFITSGGLGTMGFGFPASIGVKFANKNKKIFLITGEGSFQMMMQELSTCKQYKINIFIINLNNQSLGMVKQWQNINYSNRFSNSYIYSLPNFKNLLKSYNFLSFNFTKINYFYLFLKKNINKDFFFFLNIYINNKENVLPIQIANKSMNEFKTFFSIKKYDKKFNYNCIK